MSETAADQSSTNSTGASRSAARRAFAERRAAAYSSIAKYTVGALSVLIVFFPSTHTFVEPPYIFDEFLLVPALIFAIVSCLFYAITVIGADFEEKSLSILESVQRNGLRAVVCAGLAVACVVAYVFVNVRYDRTAPPQVVRLNMEPLNPVVGQQVRLEGHARDEDRDPLTWYWLVIRDYDDVESSKASDLSNVEEIDSNLATVFWRPNQSGRYLIEAMVSDGDKFSRPQILRIEID